MDTNTHPLPWLELIEHPAFCVKDNVVISVNSAAERVMIRAGMEIQEIITENLDCYEGFHNGNLFLTITAGELRYSACITRTNEYDIFTVTQAEDDSRLQALALAAQQLRIPLANLMTVTDKLLSDLNCESPNGQQQIGQINRSLFQLLRIVSNMSDADSFRNTVTETRRNVNFTALIGEIIEKVQTISEASQRKILYTGPESVIIGLADEEKIGRAIYNMLSNAIKFSPKGDVVEAKLAKSNNKLSFSVTNTNINPAMNSTFWNRYSRPASIEDERFGLGLGMSLIGSVACSHGGSVLIDHPTADQTRVTMTIALVKDTTETVRSPIFHIGDYAGGRDKGLLELSEILPSDAYRNIN